MIEWENKIMSDDYSVKESEELLRLYKRSKLEIRRAFQKRYVERNVVVGDFTYGTPLIRDFKFDNTKLYIGKFCSFAIGVEFVLGGNHNIDWITTYPFNALFEQYAYITGHPWSKGDITVGNDVWFGGHSKILSGVNIGDEAFEQ